MMKSILMLIASSLLIQSSVTVSPTRPPVDSTATAIAETALRDSRTLHPGMKRKDVEKIFDNASFVFNVETVYTYPRCPTIHIRVQYQSPNDFSPDDTIISVSRPYLDDVSAD